MTDKRITKESLVDYRKLILIVNRHIGDFSHLCKKLNGFNLTEVGDSYSFFDVYFGSITATVVKDQFGFYSVEKTIDIYDDEKGEMIAQEVYMPTTNINTLLHLISTY